MVTHTFNPRTREMEADRSPLVQGHPGLREIDSVSKRKRAHKGDPSTRDMEIGVMQLGRERNIRREETGDPCSLRSSAV